jgi:hypothetical protein
MIEAGNGFCVLVTVTDGHEKFGKCIMALKKKAKNPAAYQTIYLKDIQLLKLGKGIYLTYFDYQIMIPLLFLFRFKWLIKMAFRRALKKNGVSILYEKVNSYDVVKYLLKKYCRWTSWDNTKS